MLLSANPWTPINANIPPVSRLPSLDSPVDPERKSKTNPNNPTKTDINFNFVIYSSLKNKNTQKTENKGIVDIKKLCNPEEMCFKA